MASDLSGGREAGTAGPAQGNRGAGRRTLLILGASGDLASRLLLPGLGGLLAHRDVGDLLLIGSGRRELDEGTWRTRVGEAFSREAGTDARVGAVAAAARYVQADVTAEDDVRRLLETCRGPVIVYFALPPAVTEAACRALARVGLPAGSRLVLEKPFGTDAASAAALNDLVTRLVPEDSVHRVDHYLGMSTVLDILGLRFANRVFESILDAGHVESVDIVFDESLALEGRAGYYDGAGALVDMVQSHALQVLSLLAMEAPSTLTPRDLRDAKVQVLRATHLWNEDPVGSSRRARYTAGTIEGRPVPSYVDEDGVDPRRRTETFCEVVLEVQTWRWAGVPFRIRAGKALPALRKEAIVTFRRPRWVPRGFTGHGRPSRLHIGFDPDVFRIDFNLNGGGDPFELDPVTMEARFGTGDLTPYGQVLAGVFDGDATLSVRGDAAVEGWRILEPVRAAWREGRVPLQEYRAGSAGPVDHLGPQAGDDAAPA